MADEGLLIVISGPSGAGKGTLCKAFLEKNKDIKISISCTTRSPRYGEVDGKSYFFTNQKDFEEMIRKEEFLEYASVYGNYYGTPKGYVMDNLAQGKDIILEIDIQGAMRVKENYKDAIFIFILPPSMEELKNRILKRGSETEESFNKRFCSAFNEVKFARSYDYAVVNDSIDEGIKKIESIILAEKCKVGRFDFSKILKEGL